MVAYQRGKTMKGEAKERWMLLAEQAANEQDPKKLLKLVDDINRMLQAKEDRLHAKAAESKNSA
jgi:hypothetical protein